MKNDKNAKNKISFKSTLSKKSIKPLKPERINIQTITKPKNNTYNFQKSNKIKKFFEPKEIIIRDKNNDYSFDSNDNCKIYKNKNIYNSDSLNNSNNSTYTNKKRKYKRIKKSKKEFFKKIHNLSNSLESINNLSIYSPNKRNNLKYKINNFLCYSSSFSISHNSKNKNDKYSNYSSSSSKYNSNYSDSSDSSSNSIQEYKKNIYYNEMISDENELDNLTKKEIGIISSEDEENNNINSEENNENENDNSEMNNIIQENYSEDIERILIDIYNKNISIINSQNLGSPISKKLFESNTDEKKKIKNFLKKQNDEKNLLVLKILSDKIKCLIEKCKEKIYEIEEIKKLYEQYIRDNNQRYCNSIGSSGLTTNSNSSSYYGSGSDDDNYYIRNSLLLNNIQDETFCKDISQDLLTQLINIKNTLKVSSKEIENIFKYAFNSLKTSDGKKVKFKIELMQLEQFNKVILNDDLISTLLIQIKFVFSKYKEDYIVQIIEQLQKECLMHKNQMAKFDSLLNQNLGITNEENEKNNVINDNKNNDEYIIKDENEENNDKINENDNINNINNNIGNENIIDNNNINNENNETNENNDNQDINNNLFNLANSSSNDEEIIEENNLINGDNNIENNNENENDIENNDNNINNINFENIDDLVKFINEDNNQKNSNKKHKKRNKKKKKKKNSILTEEENNNLENNNNYKIDNEIKNDYINNEFDDEIIKNFKEDIIKNTIYSYEITKIKPNIPENYFVKFSD